VCPYARVKQLGFHWTDFHAVAQLIEALLYKPEGSIPDRITGIFQ
jgi:hypothetical protein